MKAVRTAIKYALATGRLEPDDEQGPSQAHIVFVHGLTGDREKTWTASDASEPWPKALLPSELPTARILTFGYDAYVTDWRGMVSYNRIANHAWNLLTSLVSYRERDDTVRVSGRVVWRTEPHLHNVLRLTGGIAFLGTPHHGSGLARWAEVLSRSIGVIKQTNTQIVEVLKRDSEVLSRIQDGFHTMILARGKEGQPIEISCFFEELPLPGIGQVSAGAWLYGTFFADGAGQVVPQDSAILPGYIPIGIRGNHMDMTKFASADDPGFQAVCGELRRWIKQLGKAARPDGNLPLFEPGGAPKDGELGPGESDRLDGLQSYATMSYAYWLQEECPDISVFWVHASSAERFRQSYTLIAQECHVPGYGDSKADVVLLLKRWLEKKDRGRWLMVIDNVDDAQLASGPGGFGQYIPECAHGSILVTTRNKEVGSRLTRSGRPIEVKKMDDSESKELLKKKLEEDRINPDDLSTLSSRLEHLPLALVQAAAFMQEKSVPTRRYLELLDKSDQDLVDLLSQDFETVGRDSDTPRAVTETWILSFDQIQRQNTFAAELLALMGFLDRHAIPLEFLSSYSKQQLEQQIRGEVQLIEALGVLKNGNGLDMHRLVQLVTRKWLIKEGRMRHFAGQALLTVSDCYPFGQYENWAVCSAYLAHGYAVLGGEGTGSRDEMIGRATLLHSIAGYFGYRGQWKDAERFQVEAVQLRNEVLGSEDPDTLSSMANLAATYRNQGRWKEAELLEEHPDTLTSMANLASTYRNQGQWTEAESLLVQVMETSLRVLGEEHPITLSSMANLASTYRNQGRWKEAELLEVQVMETSLRVLGEEHPITLSGMANLASTYRDQGRWTEAESLGVQVMEMSSRVLGEEHPDTLSSMANLAATYWNQGRWKEAELLEVQVMATRKRVLGEEHPDTLTSMANLASTYRNQGRWKEAEWLEVQVMETSPRALGEEHPDTLSSMANLAATYRNQGRWTEAELLCVQVMETSSRVLGEEHPDTLSSMANLAATYQNQGRWKEAELLEVQVMETRKRVLREEHPSTLSSMANLAATYQNQGRWKEAELLEVQAMETRKRVLGEEHPDTLSSMASLTSTYRNQGRWKEAELLGVQVIATRKRVLGEEDPDTLNSMANLAATYQNQGQWTEAESLLVQVMETSLRILGDEHPDTLSSMASLAATYRNQGRWKEAELLEVQVMETKKRVLGEEHPDTLSSMVNLA
ncbi:hypothetical protein N0V88_007230 [Collariella sp. IMI 366227]|nr:hypothetical protein N0V88_007230 [Collariella sp. IMI 366227]